MGWEWKLGRVVRRKQVDSAQRKSQGPELAKHLSVFQLIPIGIGATLGAGVYVLVGTVAREHSGPSLPFSFLIAGTAAALSAFCYAELASRCPSAGSAYHYSYIFLGEGIAWLIGWALILEYTVGASAVARGISPNLVIFFGGEENLPAILNRQLIPGTQIVVDPCAAILVIIVTGLLCAGIKESAMVQAMVTSANVCVLAFVIVVGCIIGFQSGWPGYQLQNGYLPYGINGMLGGAATVFFAYIGFDSVASAAEEAKHPQRDLPLGIGFTLLICSCLYMLVSAVIVGIMPYYAMDPDTPISSAFAQHGMHWAMYVVTAGALAALSSTLLGSLLPQPRTYMAMARDGLLPPFFSKINKTTLVPINGTLASGFGAALLAFGMNVDQLAGMVSVGTLLAFTVVAVSILILRYVPPEKVLVLPSLQDLANSQMSQQTSRGSYDEESKGCPIIFMHRTTSVAVEDDHASKHMDGSTSCGFQHPEGPGYPCEFPRRVDTPLQSPLLLKKHHDGKSNEERRRKAAALSISCICVGITVATLAASAEWLPSWIRWCVGIIGVLLFICGFTVLSHIKQDEGRHSFGHGGGFICPFVPALPAACILINIYLLVNLGASTWLRVSVWLIVGVAIYMFYGIKHSLLSESINGPTSQANQIVGALPATLLLV